MLTRRRSTLLADTHSAGRALTRQRKPSALTGVGACKCTDADDVAAVFKALGMVHAARMHDAGSAYEWTPRDWFLHGREEDAVFFPMLLRISKLLPTIAANTLQNEVRSLQRGHQTVLYPYVMKNLVPPVAWAAAHGAREDALVKAYGAQLLDMAKQSRPEARVGPVKVGGAIRTKVGRGDWGDPYIVGTRSDRINHVPGYDHLSCSNTACNDRDPPLPDGPFCKMRSPVTSKDLDTQGEKFLDPWWRCIRSEAYVGLEDSDAAYVPDYLSKTAPNGASRVAAMRSQIDKKRSQPIGFGARQMANQSAKIFEQLATELDQGTKTELGQKALAAKLGVPVESVERNAKSVQDALNEYGVNISTLRPLFEALFKSFGKEIMGGINDAVSSIAGASAAAASGFADTFKAVPIIGAFIQFGLGLYDEEQKRKDESQIRSCVAIASSVQDTLARSQKESFPIPWHAFAVFEDTKCSPDAGVSATAANQLSMLSNLMDSWYCGWKSLPLLKYQPDIRKWWTLSNVYASDPRVLEVFQTMGQDKWGGRLATDEQVMLVAAPIAVANGLDIDSFAVDLWNRSRGWSGIDDANYLYKADLRRTDGSEYEVRCGDLIANAYWAQFATLIKDAFVLAEEKKKSTDQRLSPSIGLIPSSGGGSLTPILLGTAGTGALWWYGIHNFWAAIPIAAGVVWSMLKKKEQAAKKPVISSFILPGAASTAASTASKTSFMRTH